MIFLSVSKVRAMGLSMCKALGLIPSNEPLHPQIDKASTHITAPQTGNIWPGCRLAQFAHDLVTICLLSPWRQPTPGLAHTRLLRNKRQDPGNRECCGVKTRSGTLMAGLFRPGHHLSSGYCLLVPRTGPAIADAEGCGTVCYQALWGCLLPGTVWPAGGRGA